MRAGQIIVDAGQDFTTRAFQASRRLGAAPLVAGGTPPFAFQWTILGGPSIADGQFDDRLSDHPAFTPAMTGTYLLAVTVTSADGVCVGTDDVVVEATTPANSINVNSEGRVFMVLHLDRPHTRAELRVSHAQPGIAFDGELTEADPSSTDPQGPQGIRRRLSVTTDAPAGAFVAVIVMTYDDAELGPLDESALRVLRLDGGVQWHTAGTDFVGNQPFPIRAGRSDLGRHGIDTANNLAWAVLDHAGEFTVGVPMAQPASDPGGSNGGAGPSPADTPSGAPIPTGGSMCGAMGPATAAACFTGVLTLIRTSRRIRQRRARRKTNPR